MIQIKNLEKSFGSKKVYENFNLDIEENKTLAILGNSGCGKTTLLNVMAGISEFKGEITNKGSVSYVFQTDRLVPGLTVEGNLKLVNKKIDVNAYLQRVGLLDYAKSYPKSLSAGMARRVSILRAFIYKSEILLMDEPFRNLDLGLKYKLMDFYKDLNSENTKTTMFVTHDVDEAIYIADRIIVIDKSKIIFDEKNTDKELIKQKLLKILINEI